MEYEGLSILCFQLGKLIKLTTARVNLSLLYSLNKRYYLATLILFLSLLFYMYLIFYMLCYD